MKKKDSKTIRNIMSERVFRKEISLTCIHAFPPLHTHSFRFDIPPSVLAFYFYGLVFSNIFRFLAPRCNSEEFPNTWQYFLRARR